jgi:hypothetical protein
VSESEAIALVEELAGLDEYNDTLTDRTKELSATLTLLLALVQDGTSLHKAVRLAEPSQGMYPGLYRNHLQLMLARGKLWTSSDAVLYADRVPKIERVAGLRDGHCYETAYTLAKHHGFHYLEGWALMEITPEGQDQAQRVVTHHGMCQDPATGKIIEPLWPTRPTEFLGLKVELEQVEECHARSGYFGVIAQDHALGLDLLTRGLLGIDRISKGVN